MDIKIGSKQSSFLVKHMNQKKISVHTERLLKELTSFLSVSSEYIGVFSQEIYSYSTILKELHGKIMSVQISHQNVLTLVRYIKNSGERFGEVRLRNSCERIERNINSNQDYTEDLHVLKQDLTQTLRKMNHLLK